MPRWLPPAVALAILSLVTNPAAAQEATPAGLPVTPAPSECRVEPRPPGFFEEAIRREIASPIHVTPTLSPTAPPIALPEGGGRPADAETVAAVTATVREALACNNARDYPRQYALFTDELARQSLADLVGSVVASGSLVRDWPTPPAETDAEIAASLIAIFTSPPAPLPRGLRGAVIAVEDVELLADGRVVADVVTAYPERESRIRQVFVEDAGRLLLTGRAEPSADGSPVATPST